MPIYDFDANEYQPIRDGVERARIRCERGFESEWSLRLDCNGRWRLCSATHDDDVELELSGNFSTEQAQRIAQELVDQLNEAERKYDQT